MATVVTPKYQTKLFINGEFVDAVSGKTFETINPATGEVICKVAEGDKADVDIAVKAARKAFQKWRLVAPTERCKLLGKLADLLEKNIDEFATIESIDNGKPVIVAKHVDVMASVATIRYYAGWADKLQGKTIPLDGEFLCYTTLDPVGVCGQIIPWNFPLLMLAWKIGPALACGNTIVLKPAEQTPLSALRFAELVKEAGFPAGVFNVISGYGPTAGSAISHHMDVDKVAFTGSTEVGRLIQKASAESNLKNVTLELGGKSPMIVFDDANLDEAIALANIGIFFNQGQVCCASSRIYVHEKIYDAFIEKAVAMAKSLKAGDPLDASTQHGPQVDKDQLDRILHYIDLGKKEGAKLKCGGSRIGEKGYYVEPTVFADVSEEMTISKEEIFGPVVCVQKFSTVEEVIKKAHKTHYGLAASVVTNNVNTALMMASALRAGTVWINLHNALFPQAPFGGFKLSGIGRELGEYGLRQYSEVKCVIMKAPQYKGDLEEL